MDSPSKRMLEFGFIGLALAAALIVGLEAKPSTVLPLTGTLSVELTDTRPYSPDGGVCHDCPVTSLNVTVDSVMAHREGVLNLTGGWFKISHGPSTLDIVDLTSVGQLIGQGTLPPGTINLIRLNVSSAIAVLSSTSRTVQVDVPGGKIDVVLDRQAEVRSGMITTVILDLPSSIICNGNSGMCHLKPVLLSKVEGPA